MALDLQQREEGGGGVGIEGGGRRDGTWVGGDVHTRYSDFGDGLTVVGVDLVRGDVPQELGWRAMQRAVHSPDLWHTLGASMWNDGLLRTLYQAIDALQALVDSDEPPDLHAVVIILEPDAIDKLQVASNRYRHDSVGQAGQVLNDADQAGGQYTWGYIRRRVDPHNLADVALAELWDEVQPEDDPAARLKTARTSLAYLQFVAEHEIPKGRPSGAAKVIILGLNAQEIANLEVWQLVPSGSGEEDWLGSSWRDVGATLDEETPGIALARALDLGTNDERLWERPFSSLEVTVNLIHSIGARAGIDPPSGYQGVLRTRRWGGRTVAVCGHQHRAWQEASRCVRERLEDLASPTGKRKRGLRGWLP